MGKIGGGMLRFMQGVPSVETTHALSLRGKMACANHPPPSTYPFLKRRGVENVQTSKTLPLIRGSTPKGGGG